jgi:type IV pilus assembly protein PilE
MESSMSSYNETAGAAHGFTLIELMIVVAIVAILAAIAVPAYTTYVTKTRRVAAEGCLSEYANYMERFYTTNLRYDKDLANTAIALPSLDCASAARTGQDYSYQFLANSLTSTTYTLQAVPKAPQSSRDSQCGTLSVTQDGTRGVTGAGGVAQCWK